MRRVQSARRHPNTQREVPEAKLFQSFPRQPTIIFLALLMVAFVVTGPPILLPAYAVPSNGITPNMISTNQGSATLFQLNGDYWLGSEVFFMRTAPRYPWEVTPYTCDAPPPTGSGIKSNASTVSGSGTFSTDVSGMLPGSYFLCYKDYAVFTTTTTTSTTTTTTPSTTTTTPAPTSSTTSNPNSTNVTTTPPPTTVATTTPTTTPAPTVVAVWAAFPGITITVTGDVAPQLSTVNCTGPFPTTTSLSSPITCYLLTKDGYGNPTGSDAEACRVGACIFDGAGDPIPSTDRTAAEFVELGKYQVTFFTTVSGCHGGIQAWYDGLPFSLNAIHTFSILPSTRDNSKAYTNCSGAQCTTTGFDIYGNPKDQCTYTLGTGTCSNTPVP